MRIAAFGGTGTPGIAPDSLRKLMEPLKGIFSKAQSLPRAGMPDDVAKVALFLACDDSGFVSGASIKVDGGAAGMFHTYERARQMGRLAGLELTDQEIEQIYGL